MSDDLTINAGPEPRGQGGVRGNGHNERVDDVLDLCAQSKAALSHIRALASGLRRFSTLQGKSTRPQTLESLVADAHMLTEICSSNRWAVPRIMAIALNRLFASFNDDLSRFNASSHRTCAKALDFLRTAVISGLQTELQQHLPLKVLIVDDDPVSRRALLMAFNVEEVKVLACSCGEEAIEKLREADFDIVFTDIMMPRISGLNLLPLIRDLPRHRRTPVVFVTALSDFQTKARSTAGGGCDFVAKPFAPTELLLKAFSFGLGPLLSGEQNKPAAPDSQPGMRMALDNAGAPAVKNGNGKPAVALKPAPVHRRPVHKMLGVVTVGEAGAVASCNKDALDLFGYEMAVLSGQNIDRLFPRELQSEAGREIILALHGAKSRSQAGPITLSARTKDGRVQKVSVSLSQSSSQGKISSVLLISAPENINISQKEDTNIMTTQQATGLSPGEPQETCTKPVWGSDLGMLQEALREELAASRSITASLEKHQSKLEEELSTMRESNKRLQWQLQQAEGLVLNTSGNNAGAEATQQALAAIRDEIKSLFRDLRCELAEMRERSAQAPHPWREAVASPLPQLQPMSPPPCAPVPALADPDQALLRAQLERQQSENKNQQLVQSLLCECIRKLDPTRA